MAVTLSQLVLMIACSKTIGVADYVHASLYLQCKQNDREITQSITYEEFMEMHRINKDELEYTSTILAQQFLYMYGMKNE
mgnify:CR=1 FL=1